MAFGPDGDLYVGSGLTEEVLRYQGPSGAAPGTFVGVFASGNGLINPWDLAFGPDANLYVASSASDQVLRFQGPGAASPGTFIDTFIQAGSGGLDAPRGLTFHDNGDLYVVSAASNQVLRYNATGEFIDAYADADSGLAWPIAAVFGSDGNLLVSSRDTHEVLRYNEATQAVFPVNLSAPSPDAVTVTLAPVFGFLNRRSEVRNRRGHWAEGDDRAGKRGQRSQQDGGRHELG